LIAFFESSDAVEQPSLYQRTPLINPVDGNLAIALLICSILDRRDLNLILKFKAFASARILRATAYIKE
jgi:hypothetical protein